MTRKTNSLSDEQNGTVRVQFDFARESLSRLDTLVRDVNAPTRAEVIRRALWLYETCAGIQKRGGRLGIKEPDGGFTLLLFPS
jgi:hypothetical protein